MVSRLRFAPAGLLQGRASGRETTSKTADRPPSPQRPSLAVLPPEEALRLRGVADAQGLRVPLDPLAGAVGDVAEVVGLGEPAAVAEVARRRRAGLAGAQPFG